MNVRRRLDLERLGSEREPVPQIWGPVCGRAATDGLGSAPVSTLMISLLSEGEFARLCAVLAIT